MIYESDLTPDQNVFLDALEQWIVFCTGVAPEEVHDEDEER